MRMISIDPSIHSCGVALWRVEDLKRPPRRPATPTSVHLLTAREVEWQASAAKIAEQFAALLQSKQVDPTKCLVYCEQPQYLPSKFHTTATGGLVKMAHLCGLLSGVCPKFGYVEISRWKGNLSKDMVESRIKKYYEGKPLLWKQWKKDMWDAVGIGLYVQGEF